VVVSRLRRLGRHNSYEVKAAASPEVRELFTKLGAPEEQGFTGLGQSLLRKGCCRRAFLRGAFLGGGSINRPERGYHLEMATSDEAFARLLFQTMKAFGLTVKMSNRKQGRVIYLKEGDAITSFLRLVGAHDTLLAFENVRVVKDMRNQINRLVNCDTANVSKTVNASVRQTDNIRFLLETPDFQRLPLKLREAAELRMSNPDASLQELVDLSGGDITKSGMNHRLRSLEKIADELRNGAKS